MNDRDSREPAPYAEPLRGSVHGSDTKDEGSFDARGHDIDARTGAPWRSSVDEETLEIPTPQSTADPRGRAQTGDLVREDWPSLADSYTLTREDISELLDEAGLSRGEQTVRKYMSDGKIDARKVQTQNSLKWLANETSVLRFIEELKRAERLSVLTDRSKPTKRIAGRETGPAPDIVEPVKGEAEDALRVPEKGTLEMHVTMARLEVKNEQLEARLADKDAELRFAREQITVANLAAERAGREAEQFKILLAQKDTHFAPLLNAATKALNVSRHAHTKPLFDYGEVDKAKPDEAPA